MVLRKQFKDNQFTWLMQWAYYGIQKAKEDMIRFNLVGARSLEGLGALGRLGLEGGREVFRRVLQFPLR